MTSVRLKRLRAWLREAVPEAPAPAAVQSTVSRIAAVTAGTPSLGRAEASPPGEDELTRSPPSSICRREFTAGARGASQTGALPHEPGHNGERTSAAMHVRSPRRRESYLSASPAPRTRRRSGSEWC